MTTKAPIRKVHDIPIVQPFRLPRELPQAPEPAQPFVFPVHVPEREPVPVRRL